MLNFREWFEFHTIGRSNTVFVVHACWVLLFFLISLFLPATIKSLSFFTLHLFELSLHVHAIYFIDITDVSLKSFFFSLSFLHSLALHVHPTYVEFRIFACGCRFILMQIASQLFYNLRKNKYHLDQLRPCNNNICGSKSNSNSNSNQKTNFTITLLPCHSCWVMSLIISQDFSYLLYQPLLEYSTNMQCIGAVLIILHYNYICR